MPFVPFVPFARAAHAKALDPPRARPSPTLDRGAAGHCARPVRTPAPKKRMYRPHHTPGRLCGRARRHWCRGWVTPAARGRGQPLAGGRAQDPGGSARASRAATLPEARRASRPGDMSWTAQITAVPPVSRPPKLRPARRVGGPRHGFGPRPGRRAPGTGTPGTPTRAGLGQGVLGPLPAGGIAPSTLPRPPRAAWAQAHSWPSRACAGRAPGPAGAPAGVTAPWVASGATRHGPCS